jgi:hypothetical protein
VQTRQYVFFVSTGKSASTVCVAMALSQIPAWSHSASSDQTFTYPMYVNPADKEREGRSAVEPDRR